MDPSWVLVASQYVQKILVLVESLWCAVQDEVYIMGCIAVGGLDVDLGRKLSGTVFDNTKN